MPHDWKAASLNDVSKVVREVDYRAVIITKKFDGNQRGTEPAEVIAKTND